MRALREVLSRNAVLFGVAFSNLAGLGLVLMLRAVHGAAFVPPQAMLATRRMIVPFAALAFVLGPLSLVLFERPIRRALHALGRREALAPEALAVARRRLLNEPYFVVLDCLVMWAAAAALFPTVIWRNGGDALAVIGSLVYPACAGFLTATIAFFAAEAGARRFIVPRIFPDGRLHDIPGALRVTIGARLAALFIGCNVLPLGVILLFVTLTVLGPGSADPAAALARLSFAVAIDAITFAFVGLVLAAFVASHLTQPLTRIIAALRRVRQGDFVKRVSVDTNDELGYAGDVINEMTAGLVERDLIKDMFGIYVTQEVRDAILSGRIPLDGEAMDVTVLFSDLRNFTPLAESTPPKQVVSILNEYFEEMATAIVKAGGLVLQFVGDEIMAVFGAPLPLADHPTRAVLAALDMRARLEAVNRALAARGCLPLANGIGIHTGEAVAANIGSHERLAYSLVGDTVNTASRLQGLNKEFGTTIIMSAATLARLSRPFDVVPLGGARVKGKSREVEIYTLS